MRACSFLATAIIVTRGRRIFEEGNCGLCGQDWGSCPHTKQDKEIYRLRARGDK